MKKLSILICTMPFRAEKLQRLLSVLTPQLNDFVEVKIESDEGQMTIGAKRNKLLNEATGEYVCFVDDDDLVSEDYVVRILQAIESGPDCCGIQGVITFQGQCPRVFIHSKQYTTWHEANEVYFRCPNHLNPVKRSLALETKFPESNFGEDKDYSDRLLPKLNSEFFIAGPIYFYLYEKEGPPKPAHHVVMRRRRN